MLYFPVTGNCYNCDQRGSEGCNGGVCRCKVIKQRDFFTPTLWLLLSFVSTFPREWTDCLVSHFLDTVLQMNVEGPSCSNCKSGTFHLSPENKDGCLSCFCMGVTQQCSSSTYYRDLVRPSRRIWQWHSSSAIVYASRRSHLNIWTTKPNVQLHWIKQLCRSKNHISNWVKHLFQTEKMCVV